MRIPVMIYFVMSIPTVEVVKKEAASVSSTA